MSAEIINLRKARKDKARAARADEASENRARFGRTKAEKERDATEAERKARHVDGHRRDETDD
jgi:hypothetical protein